ncbi:MAG: creatininase family protein [Gemmatimonadaceae bacterium]|nr:creatininase family protein [Gemmatimonadaceae bacterium]
MARPFVLAETTWRAIKDVTMEVAVLPWGATEAHNYHLPYGADVIESESIAILAAEHAWNRGARVIVLPTVPFGVQTGQLDIPFCLNLNPSTQHAVLRDLLDVLGTHGVRKFVILNGHGGNDFRQIIRELQPATSLLLTQVNWYQALDARRWFDEPGDHGGELETSVMLHVAPDLVRPLNEAGPGSARMPLVRAMREGWAWTPRRWTRVTDDTGVGNPARATREKGQRYVEALTVAIGEFLADLAAVDPERLYE